MQLTLLAVMACCATAVSAQPKQEREFDYVLRKTPNLAQGKQIYETCAACHGLRGEGVSDGSVPAIAGQHFNVVVKQIVDFRHDKRGDIRMQHFADDLHLGFSQQIADVSAYIAAMKPTAALGTPPADHSGADLYGKLCMRCHGSKGEGQGDWLVPRVSGQHSAYLIDELEKTARGDRPNMSESHTGLIKDLDARDIRSIAAYLSRLNP
jgi:cytochrome c553